MDSKTKKAILYSLILLFTVGLHESKIQTGIKKDVKIIINIATPSTPKTTFELAKTSQSTLQKSWKPEKVGSNTNNSKIEKLKTNKDQNNAKLRWNQIFVFSVNKRTTTAKRGDKIRNDNIKKNFWTNEIWTHTSSSTS